MSARLEQTIAEINSALENLCKPRDEETPEILLAAMSYSLLSGGKRLRAALLLAAFEFFGGRGDRETAVAFACAVEMIHAYSLIHDDLPVMDDDEYRRGRLTNHKVFGEATALLAGDALLNRAYEVMSAACLDDMRRGSVAAMSCVAAAAGADGMVGGQVADMLSEGREITAGELAYIHSHKTGRLIRAALAAGARLAGADEEAVAEISELGETLGLAFQIKDDILDVTGDEKKLGKPKGSDEKNKKATYVSMFGIDEAQSLFDELCGRARLWPARTPQGAGSLLTELTELMAKREK